MEGGKSAKEDMVASSTKNRNDGNIALKCGFNLYAHVVGWIVDAPFALTISWSHPLITDDYQEHVTLADRISDVFPKIDPERNIVDVEENRVSPKVFLQFVVQIFGEVGTIVATI